MKKYAVIAALMFSSTIVAQAQEAATTAPAAATMPSAMMAAQMAPRGIVQSVDLEAKTFTLGGVGQTQVISFTDETTFFLSKAEEAAELTDGAKVFITGRVSPDQTAVRAMNVGVLKLEEGVEAPKDEISYGRVVGTLKKEGEQLSVVVVGDEGEKVLDLGPVQPERVMTIAKVTAEEALAQKDSLAMLKGEKTDTGFNATSVQIVPLRRRMPATAPATAPAEAPAEAPGAPAAE